jgi:hypothetical protein
MDALRALIEETQGPSCAASDSAGAGHERDQSHGRPAQKPGDQRTIDKAGTIPCSCIRASATTTRIDTSQPEPCRRA